MPRFEPFRAVRYAPGVDLDGVVAPPYDVLSDADVDALAARDPRNIVHVDVPRGGARPLRDRRPAAARRGSPTARWCATTCRRSRSTACASPTPQASASDLVGVLGGLEVVDEGAGGVLPHERTTPKASTDRLDLTRATAANLSPVWGLSLATGLTDAAAPSPASRWASVTVDGVEHVVERVTDPERIAAIARPRRARRRADRRRPPPLRRRPDLPRRGARRDRARRHGAEDTLAFVGELVADQLSIEAIHRLYTGIAFDDLRAALGHSFDLAPAEPPTAATLAAMEAARPAGARRAGRPPSG